MLSKLHNKQGQIGMLRYNNSSKRGQIGETMTWVAATLIIIFILVIAVFVATAKLKGDKEIRISAGKDTLASKSFFSWLLTEDSEGKNVYSRLQEEDNLNEFNGMIGQSIFNEYYGGEYGQVWLGIRKERELSSTPNDYFLKERARTDLPPLAFPHLFEKITLDENKSAVMVLTPGRLPGLGGFG